ncbi:MAG: hypothetical protein M1831_005972 [Alyxoria varia]|nr:MAG: hypothetical protein M1831_005972 [Alyxoria varia]
MASHETSPEVPPHKPDALDAYESSMRDAFQAAQIDDIQSAGDYLLHATHRLLRNTKELSLYQENIDGHEPRSNWREKRREVWKTFNNAWLAILLRQTELCKEELRSGRKISRPASRISRNFLERMGNELTSLQDDIKNQGLSDYGELGVWDEQIKDQLLKCRELVLRLDGPFSPDIVIEDLRAKPDRR